MWSINSVIQKTKEPYPLGYIGVIGGRIGRRRMIVSPILLPITLWVCPIYWVTGPSDQSLSDIGTQWVWPFRKINQLTTTAALEIFHRTQIADYFKLKTYLWFPGQEGMEKEIWTDTI